MADNAPAVSHPHPEAVAVLAIRIWVEQISPLQLRARITRTNDVEGRDQVMSVVSTTDEIEETVRLWLHSFVESIEMVG